jgi:hypothetical protein
LFQEERGEKMMADKGEVKKISEMAKSYSDQGFN